MGANEKVGELLSTGCEFESHGSGPVIIHGAGRSGSTLLLALLRGHKDFYIPNETSFLVPRLYEEIFDKSPFLIPWTGVSRELFSCNREWRSISLAALAESPAVKEHECRVRFKQEWCDIERSRIQKEIGKFIKNLFIQDPSKYKHWGFKEIWNGSLSFNYRWSIYKEIFENPIWLHIIRHPRDFVHSMAGHRGEENPSDRFITDNLNAWVAINQKSMMLDGKRNLRVKYEDLVLSPDKQMKRIASHIGMKYDPAVLPLAARKYVPGKLNARPIGLHNDIINSISGLRELCEVYGYEL